MLYNKGNHAKLKYVQLQPSPLQGENGGKIYSAWNPGKIESKEGLSPQFAMRIGISRILHLYIKGD